MENTRTAWERLELIRHKDRPTVRDYLPVIFNDFYELHGDRLYGDDGAILGGIGRLNDTPVTIIAEGADEEAAVNGLCDLISSGFVQ